MSQAYPMFLVYTTILLTLPMYLVWMLNAYFTRADKNTRLLHVLLDARNQRLVR